MTLRALELTDSDPGRRFGGTILPDFHLFVDAAGSADLATNDDYSLGARLPVSVTVADVAA